MRIIRTYDSRGVTVVQKTGLPTQIHGVNDRVDSVLEGELQGVANNSASPLLTTGLVIPQQQSGVKHDDGKAPLALLDADWIEGVAAVMGFGAKKYSANNWRAGLQVVRCLSAALRHIFKFIAGNDLDEESGLPHLDHAACCIMFARTMWKNRPDLDDRYKG